MQFDSNKITSTKSQVAKLLAMENISVRHVLGQSTASFDVKARVLSLPVWKGISEDLYDMLVVHEVGHALETPADKWVDTISDYAKEKASKEFTEDSIKSSFHSYLNILEDVRIDNMQRKRYPGSKRNYYLGYKELYEKNFFNTEGKNLAELPFIDRLNIYYKAGFADVYVPFTDEEKELVARANKTITFDDVINIAKEFWTVRFEELKRERQEFFEDGDMVVSASNISPPEDQGPQDIPPELGHDPNFGPTEDEIADEAEEDEEEKDEYDPTHFGGQSGFIKDRAPPPALPESETDDALRDHLGGLVDSKGFVYYYSYVPEVVGEPWDDYKKFLFDHKEHYAKYHNNDDKIVKAKAALVDFKKNENSAISYMVKEFEMKKSADAYSKQQIAKSGVINTNKLHSYVFNEDIFKRNTVVPKGKDHGFVMFLDWSSSMCDHINQTLDQLFSLVLFCKRIQVPFEVYTFTNKGYSSRTVRDDAKPQFTTNNTDLKLGQNSYIRNVLSSRMSLQELDEAMIYLRLIAIHATSVDAMSGTPLNEMILIAEKIINKFKVATKVQVTNVIFLTDGCGGSPGLGDNQSQTKGTGYHIIVQDSKTKKDYMLPGIPKMYDTNTSYDWANLFLNILKDRTKINLLGFYVYDKKTDRNFGSVAYQSKPCTIAQNDAAKDEFKKNKFYEIKNSAYDSYYLLNPGSMGLLNSEFEGADTSDLDKGSKRLNTRFTKSFMSFMQKRQFNRILLRKFIEKIT